MKIIRNNHAIHFQVSQTRETTRDGVTHEPRDIYSIDKDTTLSVEGITEEEWGQHLTGFLGDAVLVSIMEGDINARAALWSWAPKSKKNPAPYFRPFSEFAVYATDYDIRQGKTEAEILMADMMDLIKAQKKHAKDSPEYGEIAGKLTKMKLRLMDLA